MTYRHEGTEYLDDREQRVYQSVRRLNGYRRTTNTSQVANDSGINRTAASSILRYLAARGFLRDISTNAACHWRLTAQPVPADPRLNQDGGT
jgi:hypothetical protein